MPDAMIVRHCAPTLAGLKTASMFTCPFQSREEMNRQVSRLNRRLAPKGIRVLPGGTPVPDSFAASGSGWNPAGSFPMKSACFWGILRRTSGASWRKRRKITNA